MFDTKKGKCAFTALLEDFIRETEHSLAYFFALIVFLLTFLLTLFGREGFYTGLIGVFCLFLIKLRDIIDGFREIRSDAFFSEQASDFFFENKPLLRRLRNEKEINDITNDLIQRFNKKEYDLTSKKPELLFYLQTLRETMEDIRSFFPKKPFRPETRQAILEMTAAARKYIIGTLETKYRLNTEQSRRLKDILSSLPEDSFLLQTQLESAGLSEQGAARTEKMLKIIRKIEEYIGNETFVKPEMTEKNSA